MIPITNPITKPSKIFFTGFIDDAKSTLFVPVVNTVVFARLALGTADGLDEVAVKTGLLAKAKVNGTTIWPEAAISPIEPISVGVLIQVDGVTLVIRQPVVLES